MRLIVILSNKQHFKQQPSIMATECANTKGPHSVLSYRGAYPISSQVDTRMVEIFLLTFIAFSPNPSYIFQFHSLYTHTIIVCMFGCACVCACVRVCIHILYVCSVYACVYTKIYTHTITYNK